MESVIIVLNNKIDIPISDYDYVGVESGAVALLDKNIPIKFAIGDFDSVSIDDKKRLEEKCEEFILLAEEKDCTDSEAAIKECIKRGYENIFILGALGKRVDHELVNLKLVMEYPQDIILYNENNRIMALPEGEYEIEKDDYQYISFFAKDTAIISLEGFKYPLSDTTITSKDIYTVSNEIVEDKGRLSIKEGIVLVIQSKD